MFVNLSSLSTAGSELTPTTRLLVMDAAMNIRRNVAERRDQRQSGHSLVRFQILSVVWRGSLEVEQLDKNAD